MKCITNTHVKLHSITLKDYNKIFGVPTDIKRRMTKASNKREQPWNKGRNWNEMYGKDAEARRKHISKKFSEIDKSYTQTEEYRKKVSESKIKQYKEQPELKTQLSLIVKKWAQKHPEHYQKMVTASRHSPNQKKPKTELLMKEKLNANNIYNIPQKRICGFFVDFYLPEYNIIIECDGDYWHNYPEGTDNDRRKNEIWEKEGYLVLRFWGSEIMQDINKCMDVIMTAINSIVKEV